MSADRKERLERLQQEKERLLNSTVQMAEAVGEEMVVLPVMLHAEQNVWLKLSSPCTEIEPTFFHFMLVL